MGFFYRYETPDGRGVATDVDAAVEAARAVVFDMIDRRCAAELLRIEQERSEHGFSRRSLGQRFKRKEIK